MPEHHPHRVKWTDERVARFWDYLAQNDADEFLSEKCAPWLAGKLIAAATPRTAIDVGCGTGPLVTELTRRGVAASGVDTSPEVLAAARRRTPAATFYEGSAVSIPLKDGCMDAATLIEVVEHLDDATLAGALAETRRILKPGGTLMITTPNDENLAASTRQCPECGCEFHFYQHVRSWTAASLADALRIAGFHDPVVRPVTPVERTSRAGRVLPLAYRALGRRPPRLMAFAKA